MSTRPRLLDLFCGAGGSAVGYSRAGFDVFGVDNDPKPLRYYPFPHVCADALEYVAEHGREFNAIHASPPCQGYCVHAGERKRSTTPRLIQEVRRLLQSTNKPFCIENIDSAMRQGEFPDGILLCGRMFNLPIIRHRWFACQPMILSPSHPKHYGWARRYALSNGIDIKDMSVCGKGRRRGFTQVAQSLMGIDFFMSQSAIVEAIPPAYTEFIGKQLLAHLRLESGEER